MLMTPMEPTRPLYESIHTWLYGVKEQAMKKRKEELSSICGGGGGWGQNKIHVGLCQRPLFLLFLLTYSCVCVCLGIIVGANQKEATHTCCI